MQANRLKSEAAAFGLALSDEQLTQFEDFEEKLYVANEHKNLTRVPREDCWSRHFLESLSLSPHILEGNSLLDIGTGAGFPGACIAIARPDVTVTAIDASAKEVEFVGSLALRLTALQARGEDLAHDPAHREQYDFVTGRALAPLGIQVEISAGLVKVGGLFVPMRTDNDREAARGPFGKLGIELVGESGPRYLPIYKKIAPTPKDFPRAWALIKKRPLA